MKRIWLAGAVASIALAAGSARAYPLPDGGATPAEVAAELRAEGLTVKMGVDSTGDPMIESSDGGASFRVLFYGCDESKSRCNSIQFTAAWDLSDGTTYAEINRWNVGHRFGRGFLDEVMDPFVQMDVDLERGSTTESIRNNLQTWRLILKEFRRFIGVS